MPLRLLEVTVPREALARIPALMEDIQVVHLRSSDAGGAAGLVTILLEAQHAEAASDVLDANFGSSDEFRLVALPVEATIPALPLDAELPSSEPRKVGANRISREELYEDIAQACRLNGTYIVMVLLSTVVAAVGLIRGDVAIIIGAMVIAPLLGPNVALALAAALGDLGLAKRSLKVIGAGVATAAGLSLVLGLVLPVDPASAELAARTNPGVGDVVLALAAGTAGTLAFTSGVPAVVVGVMVAVALLPPIVTVGLLAGSGHGSAALGALVLLVTNVTCVNLAAVTTFFFQQVRPRTWWDAGRAKKHTRIAVATWILLLAVLVALMLAELAGLA